MPPLTAPLSPGPTLSFADDRTGKFDSLGSRRSRALRNTGIVAASVVLTLLLAVGSYYVITEWIAPSKVAGMGTPTSRQQWPDGWTQPAVTSQEERAGILLKLERARPNSSFLVRSITGSLEGGVKTSDIAVATEKALRRGVRGLGGLTKEAVVIQGRTLLHLSYTQPSPKDGLTSTDLYILPTQHQTFYLSFRSRTVDYQDLGAQRDSILNTTIGTIQHKTGAR